VPQRDQFVVNIDDDARSFAKLISTLRRAGVAVEAAAFATDGGAQVARMIVMPLGLTKKALRKADFQFSTEKVLALHIGSDLNGLSRLTGVLAGQAIPVEYSYTGNGDLVVLGTSDVKRASAIALKVASPCSREAHPTTEQSRRDRP